VTAATPAGRARSRCRRLPIHDVGARALLANDLIAPRDHMMAIYWTRAWDHWRRYWLAPGGVCSIAAIRIATATGWTLAAPLAGDPVYLVAQPPGDAAPWLVAGRTYRGY
jgi:hypothetical protein